MKQALRTLSRVRYRGQRAILSFSDETELRVHIDTLAEAGISRGSPVSDAELAAVVRLDAVRTSRRKALDLLAHRSRARQELRRRLRRKEIPDDIIEETLAWLDERGYIDDEAFARAFVRDRLALRPRGPRMLQSELAGKGVARDLAERVIEDELASADSSREDLALAVGEKWLRTTGRRKEGRKRRQGLYQALARKGFSGDTISGVIGDLLAED